MTDEKNEENKKITLKDVRDLLGAHLAIPTVFSSFYKESKEKDNANLGKVADGTLFLSALLTLPALPFYSLAAKYGHPGVLYIPLATNAASLVYELGGKKIVDPAVSKIKQYYNNYKDQRKLDSAKKSVEENETVKKPSLLEKIVNAVKPEVRLDPKITVYVNDKEQKDVKVTVEPNVPEEKKNPVEKYCVVKEPYYLSINGEKELFASAFQNKLPVMLKGPTGCGKTRFVENMAYNLKLPLITVNCQEDTSAADLAGRILLNEKGAYWQDGPLALAARHGGICYLDEVIEARSDAMVLIHSLTDHRRILPIDKTGEVIDAHPNFMLVVSYNPHYQSSIKDMKQSTRQRFMAMEFGYPEYDKEVEIVSKESGIESGLARKLVKFGGKLREMKGSGLKEGASTRLLIYAGKLIKSGIKQKDAVEKAVVYPITDEPDIQGTLRELINEYFD
jgi:nitric oxide reductase NorQ protein